MITIDSHQHFWKYNAATHGWINDEMQIIRNDFLPEDLAPELKANNIDGCVSVQAEQSEQETDFLLSLADKNPFIKAVVGWIDLCNENIEERLTHYKQYNLVKGFRHILQGEEPEFMLQPNFIRGIAALQKFNYSYDILIYPHQLPAAIELVKQFPDMRFVIDHIAKPSIKKGEIMQWKKDIETIAQYQNVYCKISGIATEADWKSWTSNTIKPYLDTVVAAFETNRILFGSDHPVCLLAVSYKEWVELLRIYFATFSKHEQEHFFGLNALHFYQIN